MILIPKYKTIFADRYPVINIRHSGEFRYTLRDANGNIKVQTDWERNLVTDLGLDKARRDNISWASNMYIGDGVVAPAVSDVGLSGSQLGAAQSLSKTSSNYVPSAANYERYHTVEAVWAPGDGTGTVGEFGIGTHSGTDIAIRHLVAPTIAKGALDELTVEYKHTVYPDISDAVGTFLINAVSYDYTVRMGNLAETVDDIIPQTHLGFNGNIFQRSARVYDGAIGTITAEQPAGSSAGNTAVVADTYGGSAGSYYHEKECSWGIDNTANGLTITSFAFITGLTQWDFGDGSRRWVLCQSSLGLTAGGAGLLKENTHELILGMRMTSDRWP